VTLRQKVRKADRLAERQTKINKHRRERQTNIQTADRQTDKKDRPARRQGGRKTDRQSG
jgi:hypothetical protein